MQKDWETLRTLLLLPFFLTIEFARATLWAARTVDEPDREGPLLRALVALLVGGLSVVPKPVWTLLTYVAWLACVPVRSVLWVWGIGRENIRGYPPAVRKWYAHTRREKLQRRRRKKEDE